MTDGATDRPELVGDVKPTVAPVRSGFRPWRIIRHDIGRKLTAIALAGSLWYLLQTYVTGTREVRLEVIRVPSRAEADTQRGYVAAVYLVVPKDIIVRSTTQQVLLTVKGLRTDIDVLDMSAIIEIDPEELEDQDERLLEKPLDRSSFRSRGIEPDLAEFKVRPRFLEVNLARRKEAEFTLGAENVSVRGMPKDGYDFDKTKAIVRPNRVPLSGPRSDIDWLLEEPSRLKLSPVDVAGRVFEVSQQVGLDPEKVDRSVTLGTSGGVVEVTLPIQAQPAQRDLFAIPVRYENAEALLQGRPPRRPVSWTKALDIRVVGPRAILDGLTPEELQERILLSYDWSDAQLAMGTERVRIFFSMDLPKGDLKITDLNGRDPEIEYRLEEVEMEDPGSPSGETP